MIRSSLVFAASRLPSGSSPGAQLELTTWQPPKMAIFFSSFLPPSGWKRFPSLRMGTTEVSPRFKCSPSRPQQPCLSPWGGIEARTTHPLSPSGNELPVGSGQLAGPTISLTSPFSGCSTLRPRIRNPYSTGGSSSGLQRQVRGFEIRAATGGKQKGSKHVWVCRGCGEEHLQWWGQCQNCGEGGLTRLVIEPAQLPGGGGGGGAAARAVGKIGNAPQQGAVGRQQMTPVSRKSGGWVHAVETGPQRLKDISREDKNGRWRLPLPGSTGEEMCRVLGGGIVPGSLLLVGGDPGVGKSTLLLQLAGLLADGTAEMEPGDVLYISGEESVEQISSRAERMGISAHGLFLYSATDLELVLGHIHALAPRAVVVDSIQTVYLPEATGSAGSVSQVRECATALLQMAKSSGTVIFLVGHVTKSGEIAGPRVLEHIVDTVLYMEGEDKELYRLLRSVKNRFGSTNEIGVFSMSSEGLAAVTNPSHLFLGDGHLADHDRSGACVAVVMQGTRPLLMEVQGLSNPVPEGGSRRSNGVDLQRLTLLLAVLSKQAGLKLSKQDIFVNVVGGVQIREPAADLAIAVAIASSYFNKPVPRDMAFVGEIGLHGELRSVGQLDRRLSEAAKLGFKRCAVPAVPGDVLALQVEGIEIIPYRSVNDALKGVLNL